MERIMKKIILGLLSLTLIACGNAGGGRDGGALGNKNLWLGDLKMNNVELLERYDLCGNTRSRIKQDLVSYGILSFLSGSSLDLRQITGIGWNRGIIQNCGLMKKAAISIYSNQPYLPEGDSRVYIEPLRISNYSSRYRGSQAYTYRKLANYIKLNAPFHETGEINTTKVKGSAYLWYQEPGSGRNGEELSLNREIEVKTWRVSSGSIDKDIKVEIKMDGNIIGRSTLSFITPNQGYSQKSNTKRQVASFISNLQNHSLLLGLATGLVLLIIVALLLLPKILMKKEH